MRAPAVAGSVPAGLVDVGGYRLFIDCKGKGSPTIVLDAGLGGSGASAVATATSARACVI
jgi:hypothetical protein